MDVVVTRGRTETGGRATLSEQVAIVTGAGRGIGECVAKRLAADGAAVIVADMDGGAARRVAEEIAGSGCSATALEVNVTSAVERAQMVHGTLEAYERIDILVNNAGIYRAAPPMEVDVESWREVFAVNAEATFFCCQAVIGQMIDQGYGRLVNFSSSAARIGNSAMIAYNAAKLAIVSITRNLALEFAPYGIHANCVAPGIIDTPMWESINQHVAPLLGFEAGTMLDDRVSKIPLGRAGTGHDVASVVSFLVSEDAGYMTGQVLNVTGGLVTA
jgi:2-hydroxycyclohexanecarboxyl-CoA dehydrogenase